MGRFIWFGWEYLSACEILEIPSGRADRFTSEAQKLGNNLVLQFAVGSYKMSAFN